MAGTFSENIARLAREVGKGKLVGHLVVDQAYAQNQHQSFWFNHPDGGEAFYLRNPLMERRGKYMEDLARKAITRRGSNIVDGMVDVAEDLSQQVFNRAPLEFADLRASGHPFVIDDGRKVYDRAPMIHRLSKSELRIKSRLSRTMWPDRYRRSSHGQRRR